MKIDMSPAAVTLRLKQVSELRDLCLALAKSDVGLRIQQRCRNNEIVQRTAIAIGR